jgi:hypothetical protein
MGSGIGIELGYRNDICRVFERGTYIELGYRNDICRVLKGARTEHPKCVLFHLVRVVRLS